MPQLSWTLVYVAFILLLAAGLLARVLVGIWRRQRERRESLRKRDLIEPVHTESPPGPDPIAQAKKRGLGSIEARFSVHRKLLVPTIVLGAAALASLPFLGAMPAAVFSTVIAVATVIVGIAARPLIENAIAGLMISYSNLLRIGDIVMFDDLYGSVEDISATHTTIKIWDWRRYVIPNSQMLQAKVINYSLYDRYRWTYVEFYVSYDADPEQVREIAVRSPLGSEYFTGCEDPSFWIMGMEKDAIRCWVAAWADDPSKAWHLGADMRESMWREFRARGIRAHIQSHDLRGPAGQAPPSRPPDLHTVEDPGKADGAGQAAS